MSATVEKQDRGPRRWHVKRNGGLIVCVETKRVATAVAALANEPSPETYARLHALVGSDDAVFYAFRCGLGPKPCGADPKTGNPL